MPLEDRRQTSLQLQVAKKDLVAFKAGKLPADKFDARMSWQQRVDPVR
jgi:hypothetical protein